MRSNVLSIISIITILSVLGLASSHPGVQARPKRSASPSSSSVYVDTDTSDNMQVFQPACIDQYFAFDPVDFKGACVKSLGGSTLTVPIKNPSAITTYFMKTDASAIDSSWSASMTRSSQRPLITSSGAALASLNFPDDTFETTIPAGKLTGYYCACSTTSNAQATLLPSKRAI